MTYRLIASAEKQPKAPITAELIEALDSNVAAVASGASGAPRIASKTLTFSRSSAGSSTSVFSDADEYQGMWVDAFAFSSDPSLSTITLAVSDDGVAYSSELTLCSPSVSTGEKARAFIDFATGAYTIVSNASMNSGTIGSLPSGTITHVRFSIASGVADDIGGIAVFQGGEAAL